MPHDVVLRFLEELPDLHDQKLRTKYMPLLYVVSVGGGGGTRLSRGGGGPSSALSVPPSITPHMYHRNKNPRCCPQPPDCVRRFLEYLVNEVGAKEERFHTELAREYMRNGVVGGHRRGLGV